jgi:hypothetical protein
MRDCQLHALPFGGAINVLALENGRSVSRLTSPSDKKHIRLQVSETIVSGAM